MCFVTIGDTFQANLNSRRVQRLLAILALEGQMTDDVDALLSDPERRRMLNRKGFSNAVMERRGRIRAGSLVVSRSRRAQHQARVHIVALAGRGVALSGGSEYADTARFNRRQINRRSPVSDGESRLPAGDRRNGDARILEDPDDQAGR